mgnify:CR=1 FL=1
MSMSHGGHAGHMPPGGDRKALVISGCGSPAFTL